MTKIFADANFFIARFSEDDSLHSRALVQVKKLEHNDPEIWISNLVFGEIVTVLSQRVGRQRAIRIGNYLLSGDIRIAFVDEALNSLSWEIFQNIGKKNMGFVDCSILAVMRTEGIKKLLSFDEEDFSSLRRTYGFSFY